MAGKYQFRDTILTRVELCIMSTGSLNVVYKYSCSVNGTMYEGLHRCNY